MPCAQHGMIRQPWGLLEQEEVMAKKATGIERSIGPVHFRINKETKNKVRYEEVDENGNPVDPANEVVGTVYVSKAKIGKVLPKKMTITSLVFDD